MTKRSQLQDKPSLQVTHAASAAELRSNRPTECAAFIVQKRRGFQHHRRAASSFPLDDISHNPRNSGSGSWRSSSKEFSLSLPASAKSETQSTRLSGPSNPESAYPTPPASETDSPQSSSVNDDEGSKVVDGLPFPLNPVPLPALRYPADSHYDIPQTPKKRLTSIGILPSTPKRSPDRYISNRFSPQEPSKTFRLSKSPEQLSVPEKLLRNNSATPDPFGPLRLPRLRDVRTTHTDQSLPAANPRPPGPIGTTNITTLTNPSFTQNRQTSAGGVWNIGSAHLGPQNGPIRSISDGRGGFIGGGSNAPMYSSQFVDDDNSDQDVDRMEARLAAALEIDQTSRILDISRSPASPRSASTGMIGTKRKRPYVEPRTQWRYGNWMQEDLQSCKYLCHLQ